MAEHLLDGIQLGTFVQEAGGNAVAQDMRRFSACKTLKTTEFRLHNPIHIDRIQSSSSIGQQQRLARSPEYGDVIDSPRH